jgi:ureidoacrylate peracid hydrolase
MNRREFVTESFAALAGASAILPLGLAAGVRAGSSHATTRTFTLPAKPAPINIETAKTAIIVVDMQNDFGTKGGMLDRAGLDISMIQRAVPPTARVIAAGRKAGIKIVYLKMAFRPDLSDMGTPDSPNRLGHAQAGVGTTVHAPDGTESRILIRDTWNSDIVAALKPEPADVVIYKHRYSGFYQTSLDATLKEVGARYLIFTGCTTSVCVESTIRDAMFRDYSPVLLSDCTAEPIGTGFCRTNHEASLYLIVERNFGWVSTSEDFTNALAATPPPESGKT